MADKNIKKVSISAKDFPAMTNINGNGKYLFRYRVVSDDKARVSAWSPKYSLASGNILSVIGVSNISSSITSTGNTINVSWNIPSTLTNNTFDIYLKWGSADTTQTPSNIDTDTTPGPGKVTVTKTSHGYSTGDYIMFHFLNSNLDGVYQITKIDNNSFSYVRPISLGATISTTGTKMAKIIFANDTNGTYQYYGTTTSNNYFADIPTNFISESKYSSSAITSKFVFATVQIETVTKELLSDAKLFEVGESTYATPVDGGEI